MKSSLAYWTFSLNALQLLLLLLHYSFAVSAVDFIVFSAFIVVVAN